MHTIRRWLCFAVVVGVGMAAMAKAGDTECVYVVHKDDTLSKILLKLGITPVWGKGGHIRDVLDRNPATEAQRGNLIFPSMRLVLPGKPVGAGEECAVVEMPRDPTATVEAAEVEVRRNSTGDFCRELETFAQDHPPGNARNYLVHLAGICAYEHGNLEEAARLWEGLLSASLAPPLPFKVRFNLALVYCQGGDPQKGYDYLHEVADRDFESELEWNRHSFVEMVALCSGKIGGPERQRFDLCTLHQATTNAPIRAEVKDLLERLDTPAETCSVETPRGIPVRPASLRRALVAAVGAYQPALLDSGSGTLVTLGVDWNPLFDRGRVFTFEGLVGGNVLRTRDGVFFFDAEAGLVAGLPVVRWFQISAGPLASYWTSTGGTGFSVYSALEWHFAQGWLNRVVLAYTPRWQSASTVHLVRLSVGAEF